MDLSVPGAPARRLRAKQQRTSKADVKATIRFRKGFEDALKEEIFYYDQIKQWRLRCVDRGTGAMEHVCRGGEVVKKHSDGSTHCLRLHSTGCPSSLPGVEGGWGDEGGSFPDGACIIRFSDEYWSRRAYFVVNRVVVVRSPSCVGGGRPFFVAHAAWCTRRCTRR